VPVSSRVIQGNPAVAIDENDRGASRSTNLHQVRLYVADALGTYPTGGIDRGAIFAITEESDITYRRTPRRSIDDLSERTRRDYLASRVAQREAAEHGMSVRDWFAVAPNIKAFRRKVRAPQEFRADQYQRPERSILYRAFIARDYEGLALPPEARAELSAAVKAAWARRRGGQESSHGD
jgi:hypothetical protein